MDAYSSYVREGLGIAMNQYGHLFTDREMSILQRCNELVDDELRIVSRVIMRKHSWLRSSSVINYTESRQHEHVLTVLRQLESLELVQIVGAAKTLSCDEMWDACDAVFNKEEWKLLGNELKIKFRSGERY